MIQAIRHAWRNPWIKIAVLGVIAVLLYGFLRQTAPIWLSLGIAYTVAYLTHPISRFVVARGLPGWLGGILTTLLLLVLLGVLSLILRQVVTQLIMLVNELPQVFETIQSLPDQLRAIIPDRFRESFQELIVALRDPLANLSQNVGTWLKEQSGVLIGELSTVVVQLFRTVVIPIMTVYLIFDFERVNASIRRAVPPRHRQGFDAFVTRLDVAAGAYIKAQLLLATVVGFTIWAGLALFGMPMALALGFIAGVGNLIPFFGPILAGIPALLVALSQGFGYALLIGLFLFAVQQFDGNFLTPLVFSRATRVHPLVVILAILIGFTFLGLLGAILAVPTAAFLRQLYRDVYFESRWYRGNENEPRA